MAKFAHSMIRVFDEVRSLDFYARAFDLKVSDYVTFPHFALIYLGDSTSSFEIGLTVNFGRDEPYSIGDGFGHHCSTFARAARRLPAFSSSPIPTATRSK
jgi:lactoylglutathione lyase